LIVSHAVRRHENHSFWVIWDKEKLHGHEGGKTKPQIADGFGLLLVWDELEKGDVEAHFCRCRSSKTRPSVNVAEKGFEPTSWILRHVAIRGTKFKKEVVLVYSESLHPDSEPFVQDKAS
jgi:hypothetical protein